MITEHGNQAIWGFEIGQLLFLLKHAVNHDNRRPIFPAEEVPNGTGLPLRCPVPS